MTNIKKVIPVTAAELLTAAIVFGLCLVAIVGSRLSRLSDTSAIESDRPVHIYLHEKTDLQTLSQMLADSGVVRSKEEMVWAGRLLGWNNFNTGHYLIDGGYSYDVLLSRMSRGIQDPVEITIVPGLDKDRLISSLSSHFTFDSTQLAATLEDSSFLAGHGVTPDTWIGRMLPETYSMYWNTPPETVVRRIFSEFESLVADKYSGRLDELDKTMDEIITLASIIEWEVRHREEKPEVSGLYWNRLEQGMRLQADPTVNYAVGERRRLLYEDYKTDHPYNTYLYRGLPPGPITNPSLHSIEAALYPADHDYLYMVATPEGYHLFSETFEEHKEKSEKWREWLREQYRIKRERERQQQQTSDVR
ncbi:endolytic transglycosylase MltG [Halalkalibaculum sp. DA3122]|uniref:endolytic transglycosylase MltG n=1 Tax=unclassified Halalkalibaculum TaxID=2964617 RepID=UPI0037553C53